VLVSSAIRDITHRKETEEKLRQAERLAAIGQMVAGLAHESRNALQQTQACLELLKRRLQDRPDLLELIQDCLAAQNHLHHLYEEVRGYAAPAKLDRRPTDLGELLQATWEQLHPRWKDRDVRFTQARHNLNLTCSVDFHALGQVLRNILENALDAADDPVHIQADWSATELEGRPAVQLSVRDNGAGMTPEVRQRIFEPFFTTKTRGTGLGMAIARRIVEAHGGRIAVGRPPARGSEIIITLAREMS
jgi:hypothetical protein